jgi:hypothetical protein
MSLRPAVPRSASGIGCLWQGCSYDCIAQGTHAGEGRALDQSTSDGLTCLMQVLVEYESTAVATHACQALQVGLHMDPDVLGRVLSHAHCSNTLSGRVLEHHFVGRLWGVSLQLLKGGSCPPSSAMDCSRTCIVY